MSAEGAVIWAEEYDAFGNCEVGVETVESHLRLPGQYFDAETGLYYNLNRYYDPKIGRYLQPDPAGDGLNPYAYVGGNPVNAIDPEGLCALRMFSGMTETFVGYGFVNSGVFMAPGTLMMINGMDEAVAGFRGLWTGQPSRSVLEHAMYSTIPNDTVASSVHFASQLAISAGPGIAELIGDFGRYSRRVLADETGILGWFRKNPQKIKVSKSKYPETTQHILDAQAAGHPSVLTIDRPGIAARRKEALRGYSKVPGKQLDEYPPAMFKEGGKGASIRPVSPSDNMGAGACIGNQCRTLHNGTIVEIIVIN